MYARPLLTAAFVTTIGLSLAAQPQPAMSPAERTIVEHAQAHARRRGGAARTGGEHQQRHDEPRRACARSAQLFGAELEALGFKTRWVDGAAVKRAGHLVADHPGTGPRVLLIGHLDTVFEPDSPFQKFERVSPTSARGPACST